MNDENESQHMVSFFPEIDMGTSVNKQLDFSRSLIEDTGKSLLKVNQVNFSKSNQLVRECLRRNVSKIK
jgi:hypothetical protein